ncbi:MAG: Zn-dependent hydrolase [Proteobacteria bacterium]|nr:Zn-dependent hydrolase [Pseudomonadota bacterium]
MQNLRVNAERLWRSLMEMAGIGATAKGGVCRLTLTDLDRASRDLFIKWCREAGLAVSVDGIGNIFARRQGTDPGRPPVAFGSHLDTQPTGGKFDGALGVLAGLEVMRTLNDHGVETERPLELVSWTNEEGSRFAPPMLGSGVFCGVFKIEEAFARRDVDGKSFGEELRRIGYEGQAPARLRPIDAYFELHIEQGPVLEDEGIAIGAVTVANGQRWYDASVTGLEAHAGPTPMRRRRDALLGASRMVEAVNRIGLDHEPAACATVGFMRVMPNSRNVIPGRVDFTVDLRHPDDSRLLAMDAALRRALKEIAGPAGLALDLKELFYVPPAPFDAECVALVRAGARELGLSQRDIGSAAGHDAVYMNKVVPTAMIFVPCEGGISHNEAENISSEAAANGADVLLRAVVARAERRAGGRGPRAARH